MPAHTLGALVLLAVLAWNVGLGARADETGARPTRAGAFFVVSGDVNAPLAAELNEVLIASLERDGGAEVIAKEQLRLALEAEADGSAMACALDAGCVRRAAARHGLDFAVVGRAVRQAAGFTVELTRYSGGVELVRMRRFDVAGRLGELAGALEASRGELLRPDGALLTVEASVVGARVRMDGVLLGATPLAPREIIPGRHTVEAEREGYEPQTEELTCTAGTPCRVVFRMRRLLPPSSATSMGPPATVALSPPAVPELPDLPQERTLSAQRIAAWTTLALAVGAGATGAGLAVRTKLVRDDLHDRCDDASRSCSSSRSAVLGLRDDGELASLLANVFFGVAGAAAVTSVVLFLTEPEDSESSVRIVPTAGPHDVGLDAIIRF